ncbi:MAG: ATP-dependent 6-phosphofructokinase [Deltaproteobacteria bacterium]|nr:ATP-dependent 6-phosphofructokinase [Deltaproteobacteria bacterium]
MKGRGRIRRIGVLTGGGDAPGLNAVLRAVVRSARSEGWTVLGSRDGFDGFIRMDRKGGDSGVVTLDSGSVRGILHRGGSILGCSNRANPFAYPTIRAGKTSYPDVSRRLVRNIRTLGIDALVLIGGDGTMNMADRLMKMGVEKIVGVPKTIDNDLSCTDRTFGFATAVETAAWAIDAIQSTAAAHDRIMIVEVMGRNAGWIALEAGVAGAADVILIPEIPYRVDAVVAHVRHRARLGITHTVIVVSEGAHRTGGKVSTIARGRKGHLPRLGGAGERLKQELERSVRDHEIRVTVLGHIQRGGSPCSCDRILGTRFGHHAVDLLHRGAFGQMVALHGTRIGSCTIADAIGNPNLVDPACDTVLAARAVGTSFGD